MQKLAKDKVNFTCFSLCLCWPISSQTETVI